MIGIAHGYGLGGSGSNLWTRQAVSALCGTGATVHLVCQDREPERFGFVAEAWVYDQDGRPERRFNRPVPGPGRCIVHKPALDLLPTYIRPDRPSDYVRSILDLEDAEIEDYLARNVVVLRHVSREYDVRAWHVNHVVLLSEALRRLRESDGTRYAIMPHGSALEYVVRHDPRMQAMAARALAEADAVFALNGEIRERLARYFPDLDLEPRTTTVRVGVDTERFHPVPRLQRAAAVEHLAATLADSPRGHTPAHADRVREALHAATDHATFQELVRPATDHDLGPDADLEDKLRAIDFEHERVVTFVGRLIPAKGVSALVVAFPLILERHPRTRLLLVGNGWLRPYLHALVIALHHGDGERAWSILQWASERNQEGARPFAAAFFHHLRESGDVDRYFHLARHLLQPDRVVFTGFLEHHLLAHVFPLADAAVFPSAVAEASPLVIPEAAACGCLPMGTDFAGMKHSLDSLAPRLPEPLRPLLRLRPDPEFTVHDIAHNVTALLDSDVVPAPALRKAAVDEYDWRRIAALLSSELHRLASR
jgi:glycosyltransferase involved in cell wall biosynthesis